MIRIHTEDHYSDNNSITFTKDEDGVEMVVYSNSDDYYGQTHTVNLSKEGVRSIIAELEVMIKESNNGS